MISNGRALVADTFIDVGTFVRPSKSAMSVNEATNVATPGPALTVYSGPCRVKKPSTEDLVRIFGDTDVSVQRRVVRVAHNAPEIRIDDIFTATVSGDAEVLRQDMRVRAVVAGSMNMYRDFGVEVDE